MPYVSTSNSRIYYSEYGGGSRPVVLLHGNNEDSSVFASMIPVLPPHYKIYAFDTPYHGQSTSSSDISYLSFARETAEAIRLIGLDAPSVIGYSDGGIIGLIIALKKLTELDKLVTIGANFHPNGLTMSCKKTVKAELRTLVGIKRRIAELMLTPIPITLKELSEIDIHVLVVAGERDVIKARHTKALARAIPRSSLDIIQGGGHFLLDNGACFAAINSFLFANK